MFVEVVQHFLGNHKAENYIELVENMLGCNMSIKGHYLHSQSDRFSGNLSDFI